MKIGDVTSGCAPVRVPPDGPVGITPVLFAQIHGSDWIDKTRFENQGILCTSAMLVSIG